MRYDFSRLWWPLILWPTALFMISTPTLLNKPVHTGERWQPRQTTSATGLAPATTEETTSTRVRVPRTVRQPRMSLGSVLIWCSVGALRRFVGAGSSTPPPKRRHAAGSPAPNGLKPTTCRRRSVGNPRGLRNARANHSDSSPAGRCDAVIHWLRGSR